MKNIAYNIWILVLLKCSLAFPQAPISMGNVNSSGETTNAIHGMESINGKLFFTQIDDPAFNSVNSSFANAWISDGTQTGTVKLTGNGNNPSTVFNTFAFTNVNNLAFFFDNQGLWKSDGTPLGTILIKPNVYQNLGFITSAVVNGIYYFVNSNDYKLWKSDGTTAGTVVVKDLNSPTQIGLLTSANGLLFFVAEDPINGRELWKSDGTEAGTVLVKDIYVGANSSDPAYLTVMNNVLYFRADDGVTGGELWRSDGTAAGTYLVSDIYEGIASGSPQNLVVVGGTLYFTYSNYLWKSDGTTVGTVAFGYFYVLGNSYNTLQKIHAIYNVNGTLFLSTSDYNVSEPSNLMKSDGTVAGTIFLKNLKIPLDQYYFGSLKNKTVFNSTFYFSADDGINGFELWKSDGTVAGTVMVKNINDGILDSNPVYMSVLNSNLYFFANTKTNGYELWKSDGTTGGTSLVKDIEPNNFDSNPSQFTIVGTNLFFSAITSSSPTIPELILVKTNLSYPFAQPLKSAFGVAVQNPTNLINLNNVLYFSGGYSTNGVELWKSEGTYNTTIYVKDINGGASSSNPDYLTVSNNTLFFAANNATNGRELWKSDGTTVGTVLVKDIYPTTTVVTAGGPITTINDSSPFRLTNHNGILYFAAKDGNGTELWKSDGTLANTVMVNNINFLSDGLASTAEIVSTPNTLFFTANNGSQGIELWKVDATNPNGVMIKDISLGASSSTPTYLTAFGNSIYFSGFTQGFDGRELWKSDGTAAGTVIVKNIAGNLSSNPMNLFIYNGMLYYSADDNVNGRELWQSDGTLSGTIMLKNIHATASSNPSDFCIVNNVLYFTADDGIHGRELWKTDGTTQGTVLVYNQYDDIDGNPLTAKNSSNPTSLFSYNNILYFAGNAGIIGREPYRLIPCTIASKTIIQSDYLPSETLHTTQTITTNAGINAGKTTNFFAENYVSFNPGFTVTANASNVTVFRAETKGCN
jgi:ELWxxDGT repeat protein